MRDLKDGFDVFVPGIIRYVPIYPELHTHQNGQYGLQQGWCRFPTHEHTETAPQVLNSLGYQTSILSKVHVEPGKAYPLVKARERRGRRQGHQRPRLQGRGRRDTAFFSDVPDDADSLADKPEFEALLRDMRAELEDWQYGTDDPWLFRDGVSVMTTHAAQKLGMRLSDRFDFDPKNPGSAAGPHWVPRSAKSSIGLLEFG
ncbi:hypothetical protein DL768_001146 [Monosporascus sp. mg162]|nr:hypothetical protein DL768_001146 [Monosporascus sp. mg162]